MGAIPAIETLATFCRCDALLSSSGLSCRDRETNGGLNERTVRRVVARLQQLGLEIELWRDPQRTTFRYYYAEGQQPLFSQHLGNVRQIPEAWVRER